MDRQRQFLRQQVIWLGALLTAMAVYLLMQVGALAGGRGVGV
jgi:hypothetical protein